MLPPVLNGLVSSFNLSISIIMCNACKEFVLKPLSFFLESFNVILYSIPAFGFCKHVE